MKKTHVLLGWVIGLSFLFPFTLTAQSYNQLWKDVEAYQQKDLPRSVMETTRQIYEKAKAEHNLPQLMKAHLMHASAQLSLTPDSIEAEQHALKAWAAQETDTVARAILNSILGEWTLSASPTEPEEAIRYFRLSVENPLVLRRTSAKDFRPMTESGKDSEKYFDDNLLDLLARRAVQSLMNTYGTHRLQALEECLAMYDILIGHYREKNRTAALLVQDAKLWFQAEQMNRFTRYRLPEEEIIGKLRDLATTYGDLPACADVYVKLAQVYRQYDKPKEAVEAAREGLKKYPQSEWTKELQAQIDHISRPELNLHMPFIYPQHKTELNVSYTNVKEITLDLYRLSLAPQAAVLQFRQETDYENLIKAYGRKVSSTSFALAPTPDYRQRDTLLRYQLPEEGIYLLKYQPAGAKLKADYTVLFVSPYQAINQPLSATQQELIAVDRLTGHPVPGAEVVTYQFNIYDAKSDYTLWNVHPTDAEGRTVINMPQRTTVYYNVRTKGHDYMAISPLDRNRTTAHFPSTDWKRHANLFTDRSLYRPGQTVHVSGIVYEQLGDSTQVKANETGTLRLYSGKQDWTKAEVCTDEMGVFTYELVLPEDVLPDTYRLSAYGTTASFKVAEYKRPTFDVRFTPYEAAYTWGDSIHVSAEAKTYSGAPVRSAQVKYQVTRRETTWYRGQGTSVELASGLTQTDSEGKFAVDAVLLHPEEMPDEGVASFYIYKIEAEVTDGAGETRQGALSLPIGKQSLGLQIKGLNPVVVREKQERIQFQVMNLNGQPVKAEVDYRIFPLDKDGKQDPAICQGTALSQHAFVPEEAWQLPSGKYCMEISTYDQAGRRCSAKQEYVLFSVHDTIPPVETTVWFYQDGDTFESDEAPAFYVGSSEEDACLFIRVYDNQRRIDSRMVKLNRSLEKFSFPYREAYGDAITVSFALLRKGVLYTRQARIVRPNPDKRLTMKWETFRDKLQPGAEETWMLHIAHPSGSPAKANLMAVLYDASLDALQPHLWRFSLSYPRTSLSARTGLATAFGQANLYAYCHTTYPGKGFDWIYGTYSKLSTPLLPTLRGGMLYSNLALSRKPMAMRSATTDGLSDAKLAAGAIQTSETIAYDMAIAESVEELASAEEAVPDEGDESTNLSTALRENFAETAFFYPNLRTDSLGNVCIAFTVPDALTQWRFMSLAHTQAIDYAQLTDTVCTSKTFMIQPNLPRFVRKGDRVTIAASLINLAMETVSGTASIEWIDPMTRKIVDTASQAFAVGEGETGIVRFEFDAPETYDVLICKVKADAGTYSDGEQHYLPLLTDKQWVTETIPVQLKGNETKTVHTADLFNGQSQTATGRRLTVEMTANPEWYAVQALPVIGNPTEEDALAWATAYYANALASHIVEGNPHIAEVFRTWKATGADRETLTSNLLRNQDLKNLLLAETPWLAEATDETEQKRRIALLFDPNGMNNRLQTAVGKLRDLQLPDGSWGWYEGMKGNRYITTSIVKLLARLQAMGITPEAAVRNMYARALSYLKAQAENEYETLRRKEAEGSPVIFPDGQTIHYLYICALDKHADNQADRTVNDYFLSKLENRSASFSIYEKALIAIIFQKNNRTRQAADLLQSIREYAVSTDEMGVYFDTRKAHYSWMSYKIPTQVAAMEAIRLIEPASDLLDGMRQWLLKQKQVQVWETPIATADAVYAFLSTGNELHSTGKMHATVGQTSYSTPDDALGYARQTFTREETHTESIRFERNGEGLGWGAVYAQYVEEMDKVSPARGTGLQIVRRLYIDGKEVGKDTRLQVGDKVSIRLTITADRDMDFVQVKDERAACMEPEQQLSGYRWKGGIGYYEVTRDASTSFFIDHLRKGTYQLEYTVYIDRAGAYQAGIASVQSAYAPAYSGHTAGKTLIVK